MSKLGVLPIADLEWVVASCAGLWDELRGQTILVTGATGFFGRWLLESLLLANDRLKLDVTVLALSRNPRAFAESAPHLAESPKLRWLTGSVRTLNSELLRGQKVDAVIHLATEADTASTLREPLAAIDVITGGTQRALDVARAAGAQRFLFTSSGSAYGRLSAAHGPVEETVAGGSDVSDMDAVYAISGEAKRHAELLCAATTRQHGLPTVIARCFAFAGPALPVDGKFALGNFLRDALERRPIVITGDGTPVRSYLYASDLAVWLWTLLIRGRAGRIYNVGSDQPITLRALAELVAAQTGRTEVIVKQTPVPGAAPHFYVPSIRRAQEELGLQVTVGLEEAIRRTARWMASSTGEQR